MIVDFTPKIKSNSHASLVAHLDNEITIAIQNALPAESTAGAYVRRRGGIVQDTSPMKVMPTAELDIVENV